MKSDTTFATSRVFPQSPAAVFAAFAAPKVLASWWGPDGFTNTFETFDFRVGGRWKFVMHGPDGRNYPNESEFLALDSGSRLVIRHLSPPHFTLTVALIEHPEGTRLDWIQAFDDAGTAQAIRHIVEPANEQNLDRLGRALGELAIS